ncbi:MAG: hypothetical protein SWJ54_04150 [Cyanobacteriota bacterium]|nr:hypothetical protein [Cyanobacteriota bacterium]
MSSTPRSPSLGSQNSSEETSSLENGFSSVAAGTISSSDRLKVMIS